MMTSSVHEIGALCIDGDWACSHGDMNALRAILDEISVRSRDAERDALADLAALCLRDPRAAIARWMLIKDRLRRDG